MSRYMTNKGDGTTIGYGFNASTGGFFFRHFFNAVDVSGEDGLILTDLLNLLAPYNFVVISKQELIKDFIMSEKPTSLDINIGKMFGKDIIDMLSKVGLDIMENYNLFLPGDMPWQRT